MRKTTTIILFVSLLLSCSENYLETTPTASVSPSSVFTNTQGAYMAINGMHRHMFKSPSGIHSMFGQKSIDMRMDVMGEDCFQLIRGYTWFIFEYQWSYHRNAQDAFLRYIWKFYYEMIGNANYIIAYIDQAEGNQADKDNVKGQALAYRAFCYFQLVQLWGKPFPGNGDQPGVPLVLEPATKPLPRAKISEVYARINSDLDEAIRLLNDQRPAKSHISNKVAKGLKARVALVTGDWPNAAKYAREARSNFQLMSAADYFTGFNSSENSEWMWASIITDEQSTTFGSFFSFIDASEYTYAAMGNFKVINRNLYNFFPSTDVRTQLFDPTGEIGLSAAFPYMKRIAPYLGFKFRKFRSGWGVDYVYMRAAEMYLIEAEALARTPGKEGESRQALYELAKGRDAGYQLSTNSGQALINEILNHRRLELWGEGFRFTDLKRLNLPLDRTGANHDPALAITMSVPAGDKRWQFLIPQDEMNANPEIVQNEL